MMTIYDIYDGISIADNTGKADDINNDHSQKNNNNNYFHHRKN